MFYSTVIKNVAFILSSLFTLSAERNPVGTAAERNTIGDARDIGRTIAARTTNYNMIAVILTILGTGILLFGGTDAQETLKLVECKPYPGGVVLLRYLR